MASTGDNPAVILQVKEGDQNRRVCATVLHLHTSSSEEKQNPAADLRRSIPSELTVTGYKRSQGPSAQQQEGANGSHHGLPNGKKVGTLSLHSSSVSQERDVKEYRRFMEYLFHGLAGTSPPKAAKVKPWIPSMEQVSIYLMPPKRKPTEGEESQIHADIEVCYPHMSSNKQSSTEKTSKKSVKDASDDPDSIVYTIEDAPDKIKSKASYLFKDIPEEIRDKMKVDSVSLYSLTQSKIAREMADILEGYTGSNATVVDATACAGGNTIWFAKKFKRVEAIEISAQRVDILKHNIDINDLSHKVHVHHGDYLELYEQVKGDIVFFDPPWGGPEYMNLDSVPLELGDPAMSIGLICTRVFNTREPPRYIAIKAPVNFNEDGFNIDIQGEATIVKRHDLWKMRLYIVQATSANRKRSRDGGSAASTDDSKHQRV